MAEEKKIQQVNIVDVVKQAVVQVKYEEMGSWLATHKTPLFYAHSKGLSIVDVKFIEKRPWLKEALERMVKDIEKQKQEHQSVAKTIQPVKEKLGYIG